MRASPEAYRIIKKWEGLRLEPYVCDGGVNSIGWDHAIRRGEIFHRITEVEAEKLLVQDVRRAETAINRLVSVKLSQGQMDALISFAFNVGAHAFKNSTLLRYLNAGNYEAASMEFDRWVYAKKRKLKGLVDRRNDEEELFLSLPWQKPQQPKE